MNRLASGLAAFAKDLGPERLARTSVVVMTEFGRRVAENSAGGTDHGHGSAMFLMGGGIQGGRVLGKWPGLGDHSQVGPGDLSVANNYRDVLSPILSRLSPATRMQDVFPGYELKPMETLFGNRS